MKAIAFATVESVEDSAPPPVGKTEHERDHEILEQQDRQHEVGFLVGEAPEVDQALDGDRARRDVDPGAEDECAEAEPECGEADDEADAPVDDEVDRSAESEMTAGPREPAQAELEPEEEEQEMIPSSATNSVTSDGRMRLRARGSFGPRRIPVSR
jgi:hypothetical protein